MKCPFKKIIAIRSYEHEEKFGNCESDCPARATRADGSIGCIFIERYRPQEEVKNYDIPTTAGFENRLSQIW